MMQNFIVVFLYFDYIFLNWSELLCEQLETHIFSRTFADLLPLLAN